MAATTPSTSTADTTSSGTSSTTPPPPHASLDPAITSWLERLVELEQQIDGLTDPNPAAQRPARIELSDRYAEEFCLPIDPRVSIEEIELPVSGGRTSYLRRYRPRSAAGAAALPSQLFLHGGAFIFGSPREQVNDRLLSHRAAETELQIFSLAYGLAPEHPYPVGRDDALTALGHLAAQADELGIDTARLGLGGNSAGATIAASTALAAVAGRGPTAPRPHHLFLEVPAGSFRLDQFDEADLPEDLPARARELSDSVDTVLGAYLPDPAAIDEFASPADAPDPSGLPPTVVVIAEYDELRPTGQLLAQRWQAAGVPVTVHELPGHLHASCSLTATYDGARQWQTLVAAELGAAYHGPTSNHSSLSEHSSTSVHSSVPSGAEGPNPTGANRAN